MTILVILGIFIALGFFCCGYMARITVCEKPKDSHKTSQERENTA